MSITSDIQAMFAIDAEARRLERERIMGLFDGFVSEILKAASESSSIEVAWVLQKFVDAVNDGSTP